MKRRSKILYFLLLAVLFLLAWAPWINNKHIHDKVFDEKAELDGTIGWVIGPDGTGKYELICDYQVNWLPFGRYAASCEGGYFVTFWGKII